MKWFSLTVPQAKAWGIGYRVLKLAVQGGSVRRKSCFLNLKKCRVLSGSVGGYKSFMRWTVREGIRVVKSRQAGGSTSTPSGLVEARNFCIREPRDGAPQ